MKYGSFPINLGTHITFTVHKPIKLSTFKDKQALISSIETTIKEHVHT